MEALAQMAQKGGAGKTTKSLALMAQKGGAGKTSTAVHLAVQAMTARHKVVILDLDPQQSASAWSRAREGAAPDVVPLSVGELGPALGAAQADGYGLVLVDTPPHATAAAATVASLVDAVLMVTRPDAFDIDALAATVKASANAKRRGFLLAACPLRAPEVAEARMILEEYDLPICPVELGLRRPFARSIGFGKSVAEFQPGSKAAQEVADLWAWVKKELLK